MAENATGAAWRSTAAWTRAALALWTLGAVGCLLVWRNFTVDDAFIGWRHGFNLVEHGVFAFNATGERVEAATSTMYGLLAAIPSWLGVDVVLFFKLVSIVVVAGFLWVARQLRNCSFATRATFVLAAIGGPIQAIHLWSGLETGLFVLLATWLCLVAVGRLHATPVAIGVVGAALVLTRQEGVVFLVPAIWLVSSGPDWNPYRLPWTDRDRSKRHLQHLRAAWLVPLALLVVLTIFRWVYFGSPIPNTLSTKARQRTGLGSLASRLYDNTGAFIVMMLVVTLIALLLSSVDRKRYVILSIAVAVPSLLVYLPSTLLMNYAQRFGFQMAWPMVLTGIVLLPGSELKRVAVAIGATLVVMVTTPSDEVRDLIDYYPRMSSAMLPLGEALAAVDGEAGTLVMGDAGQVPFVSGWTLLDTHFLGTPADLGSAGIADRISEGTRTVLALYANSADADSLVASQVVFRDAAVDAGYTLVGSIEWRSGYWYQVWVSPDLEIDEAFVDSLRQVAELSTEQNGHSRVRSALTGWYWSVD